MYLLAVPLAFHMYYLQEYDTAQNVLWKLPATMFSLNFEF